MSTETETREAVTAWAEGSPTLHLREPEHWVVTTLCGRICGKGRSVEEPHRCGSCRRVGERRGLVLPLAWRLE